MPDPRSDGRRTVRIWVRRGFIAWATFVMLWLANSVRTRGVDKALLQSSAATTVIDGPDSLIFSPRVAKSPGLIFICGSGIAAAAYAPLLRPVADAGYPVVIVRLPYRFAPLEAHRQATVQRVRAMVRPRPGSRWVVAGHSLGAALACRVMRQAPPGVAALVLVGTTHPRDFDLSSLRIPVTKVYATHDGIAPVEKARANSSRLPPGTSWVEIKGGNHSQFGSYGRQLFDGKATIDRPAQQRATRAVLLEVLGSAAP
jgi:pimeloyl-ACP methyl ester carboxylesterase